MGDAFTNVKYSLWSGSICAFMHNVDDLCFCGYSMICFLCAWKNTSIAPLYLTENDLLPFSAIGHLNFVEQKLKVSKSYMYIKFVFYTCV